MRLKLKNPMVTRPENEYQGLRKAATVEDIFWMYFKHFRLKKLNNNSFFFLIFKLIKCLILIRRVPQFPYCHEGIIVWVWRWIWSIWCDWKRFFYIKVDFYLIASYSGLNYRLDYIGWINWRLLTLEGKVKVRTP